MNSNDDASASHFLAGAEHDVTCSTFEVEETAPRFSMMIWLKVATALLSKICSNSGFVADDLLANDFADLAYIFPAHCTSSDDGRRRT
jgi:hypothetical protein